MVVWGAVIAALAALTASGVTARITWLIATRTHQQGQIDAYQARIQATVDADERRVQAVIDRISDGDEQAKLIGVAQLKHLLSAGLVPPKMYGLANVTLNGLIGPIHSEVQRDPQRPLVTNPQPLIELAPIRADDPSAVWARPIVGRRESSPAAALGQASSLESEGQ